MDFKSGNEDEKNLNQAPSNSKWIQSVLLVFLLALMGIFAYVYFFTGLIKSQLIKNTIETTALQVVKKPIPSRVVDMDKTDATAALETKNEITAPSGAVDEPPKAATQKRAVAGSGQACGERWCVTVGPYLLEDNMATDLTRIRKAGFEAAVRPHGRKKACMNRLFLAEYDERSTARAELRKLKRYTSDAFIIDHDGNHAVYAGSYLLSEQATSEKDRLASAGITLTLKRAEVAIPARVITIGTYTDKKSAEAALKKLRQAGFRAYLSR